MKKLEWNVFREDFTARKIVDYNALNDRIVSEIVKRTKKINDKESFLEEVKHVLMYYYWCKSEHEIILTDWPSHITKDEINRLNEEYDKYYKEFGDQCRAFTTNLQVERKVDVWEQINLNWSIFSEYVWGELKENA